MATIGLYATGLSIIATIPQIYLMQVNHNARNVSVLWLGLVIVAIMLWMVYAYITNCTYLLIKESVFLILYSYMILLAISYNTKI